MRVRSSNKIASKAGEGKGEDKKMEEIEKAPPVIIDMWLA